MFTIKNVSKQFGAEHALNKVSLEIGRGLHFIVGASGSGKTTLLKILGGMESDFQGEAYFCDEDLKTLSPKRKSQLWSGCFGFIWQDFNLLDEYSVLENVLLPAYLGQEENQRRALGVLRELNIEKLAGQKVGSLSGGQKQRVAIARELMKDPQVIFADEPSSALDASAAKTSMELLRSLAKRRTVVVITHDRSLIDRNAKVFELDKGELISSPTPLEGQRPVRPKPAAASRLSLPAAFSLGLTATKRQWGRVAASTLSLLLAATLLLVSLGGAMTDKNQEALDELFASYGESLLDITVVQSFMSAGGTDGHEPDGPKADVTQNIEGLFEQYQDDPRVAHVLFAQAFDKMTLEVDGQKTSIQSSGNVPVFDKLLAGKLPTGSGKEVAVPESFVKAQALKNEEILGKELRLEAQVYNWESGEPVLTPVSVTATVVGVFSSDMVFEYEGELTRSPIEDSIFFSPAAILELRERANMKPQPGSFYIRATTPQALIALKDELNAAGIVPLGRFELVEDIVRLGQQNAQQSGTAVLVIAALSLTIVLAVALLSASLRRREYAIFKISGYSAAQLTALAATEHLLVFSGTALLFLAASPLLNLATLALWDVNILSAKLLVSGILLTLGTALLSFVATRAVMATANIGVALRTGDR